MFNTLYIVNLSDEIKLNCNCKFRIPYCIIICV